MPLPSLPSAILPVLLLMLVAPWLSHGQGSMTADAPSPAEAVLQRFIVSQEETTARRW